MAKVLEEEMMHRKQGSVLFRMYLQQLEEVKAQSQEIHCLSALVQQQQEAIQRLMSPHSPPRETKAVPSSSESQLDTMQEEVFNMVPGTVNTMCGTEVSHNTMITNTPMVNQTSFEDMLAEEAHSRSNHQPKYVKFLDTTEGVLQHLPHLGIKKRWPYHQGLLVKTTLEKLVSMWQLTNSGKCGSQRLVN